MTGPWFTALGVGIVTIGAAWGISKLACSAMDGIARQPEASKDIRGAMIVAAGLIEGVAVISCVVCLLTLFFR